MNFISRWNGGIEKELISQMCVCLLSSMCGGFQVKQKIIKIAAASKDKEKLVVITLTLFYTPI